MGGGRLIKQECCSIPGFLSMRVQERGLYSAIYPQYICIHLVRALSSGGGGGGGGGAGEKLPSQKLLLLPPNFPTDTLCNSLNHLINFLAASSFSLECIY